MRISDLSSKILSIGAIARRQRPSDQTGDWNDGGVLAHRNPREGEGEPEIFSPTRPCARPKTDARYSPHHARAPFRREAIAESLYYAWSKAFFEVGKRRLAGDTARAANRDEVKALRKEDHEEPHPAGKSLSAGRA